MNRHLHICVFLTVPSVSHGLHCPCDVTGLVPRLMTGTPDHALYLCLVHQQVFTPLTLVSTKNLYFRLSHLCTQSVCQEMMQGHKLLPLGINGVISIAQAFAATNEDQKLLVNEHCTVMLPDSEFGHF